MAGKTTSQYVFLEKIDFVTVLVRSLSVIQYTTGGRIKSTVDACCVKFMFLYCMLLATAKTYMWNYNTRQKHSIFFRSPNKKWLMQVYHNLAARLETRAAAVESY